MMQSDFQLAWHVGDDWGEWGSRPRNPLVQFDFAHKGEWMISVIGPHPVTGKDMIYHVVRCELCICTHLWPLSTPEELAHYYCEQFYSDAKPAYLEQYNTDRQWWLATHRTIFDAAQPWLPDGKIGVLDVGAGPGFPLHVAQERGYDTLAIEPSPVAADYIVRKIGSAVFHGTLTDYWQGTYRHKTWQMAYLWEVLEHQPNPEEFLLQCYDLLVPGGVIVVAVPSDWTAGQLEAMRRFNLPPWFVAVPDHQFYWSSKTLQLTLRRCGFQIRYTRMTYPFIEEFMVKEGICYVGDPELGRKCHHRRVAFELEMINTGRWHELEETYINNVEKRVGREIIMVGTKSL